MRENSVLCNPMSHIVGNSNYSKSRALQADTVSGATSSFRCSILHFPALTARVTVSETCGRSANFCVLKILTSVCNTMKVLGCLAVVHNLPMGRQVTQGAD